MTAARGILVGLALCAAAGAAESAASGYVPHWFAGGSYSGTIKYNGLELTGAGSTAADSPTLSITVFGTELSATYVIDEAEQTVDVTWVSGPDGCCVASGTALGQGAPAAPPGGRKPLAGAVPHVRTDIYAWAPRGAADLGVGEPPPLAVPD